MNEEIELKMSNYKAQMPNQAQMLQCQIFPVWHLDFDIYPVKFPLCGTPSGDLTG